MSLMVVFAIAPMSIIGPDKPGSAPPPKYQPARAWAAGSDMHRVDVARAGYELDVIALAAYVMPAIKARAPSPS
jgi:hypothetical protein